MAGTVKWVIVENRFPTIIKGMEAKADAIVRKTAMDLEAQIKVRAPVRTGFLRGSVQATRVKDRHWRVTVGAEYGLYVEHGTVHTAPHPFVHPAVAVVRPVFLSAMRKVVSP